VASKFGIFGPIQRLGGVFGTYKRAFLVGFGCVCVGLGAIGAVLPVMPTTIFLLVALWAFARSSPRLHDWLLSNPHYGPLISDWQEYGVIPFRAKCIAIAMIAGSMAWLTFGSDAPGLVVIAVAVVLASVSIFIATRPSRVTV